MQQEDKIVDFDVGEFICFLIVVLSAEGLSFGLADGKGLSFGLADGKV